MMGKASALPPMTACTSQRRSVAYRSVIGFVVLIACQVERAAVHLNVARANDTPRDASVYIDEQFVGFLGVVSVRGVRLPEGEHRVSVERAGYFPWDRLVVSDRQPVFLTVELRKIPD
jgi:hypothetical protein